MNFSDFNLEPELTKAIDQLGYKECTPIQNEGIPHLLEGRDISGLAQTGTGKTAAFLIPLIDRVLKGMRTEPDPKGFSEWRAQNCILILVPTRELAEQVYENTLSFIKETNLKAVVIYGGTSYDKQKEGLRAGVEFVIATPGRLIDLYKEHFIDFKQVRGIVFDEADRMFDMGFKDDMKFVLQRVPKDRQIAVFSATLNFDVLNTIYQFGSSPVEIDVSRDQTRAENVKDQIFHVSNNEKPKYLLSILKSKKPRQVVIFSNFKNNVETISGFLNYNGCPSMGISSLLSQSQRNRVIDQFKAENENNILVATDVAARGLDIKGVDMVINFELPMDAESYVHRIGRTGRAGAEGLAFSLVSDRDVESLQRIETYLKKKLDIGWMEDADIVKEFSPMKNEDYSRHDAGGGGKFRSDRGPRAGGRPEARSGGRPEGRPSGRPEGRQDGRPDSRQDNRPDSRNPARAHRPGGNRTESRPDSRGPRPEGTLANTQTKTQNSESKQPAQSRGPRGMRVDSKGVRMPTGGARNQTNRTWLTRVRSWFQTLFVNASAKPSLASSSKKVTASDEATKQKVSNASEDRKRNFSRPRSGGEAGGGTRPRGPGGKAPYRKNRPPRSRDSGGVPRKSQ